MAIAFVSRAQGGDKSGSTTVSSPSTSHTAGNLLVALIQWQMATFSSIADTAGNTWTLAGSELTQSNNKCRIYYAYNITGNAGNSVTVTLASSATYRAIVVQEFSGILVTDPIDGTSQGTGNSTSISSGYVTVTASEAVICMFALANGVSISNATYNITNFSITGDTTKYFADGYHIVTASEAATATCGSGLWYCNAAAFKVAGGAAGQPTIRRFGGIDAGAFRCGSEGVRMWHHEQRPSGLLVPRRDLILPHPEMRVAV